MSTELEPIAERAPAPPPIEPAAAEVRREEYLTYRAMSSVAVVSFAFGILSVVSLLNTALGIVPFMGMVLGIRAIRSIRRRPDELTGTAFARAGLGLSLVFLLGSWGVAGFEYATEVPEGYERISYSQLQPGSDQSPDGIPQSALDLNGKQVFIKGYVYPFSLTSTEEPLKTFVLVRDNGTCCFGGTTPKLTDMIQVTLTDPLRLTYTPYVHKLAGTFRVDPTAVNGLGAVLYQLEADHAH
jgi:hypothetical protein